MQNLKFGVLVCGLLGALGVFLPMVSEQSISISFWQMRGFPGGGAQVFLVLISFLAAAAMGGMAVAKGMQRWMSIVATVAFAFVLFKFRDGLFDMFKGAIGAKLMGVGMWAGLIVSVLTLVKPEPPKA